MAFVYFQGEIKHPTIQEFYYKIRGGETMERWDNLWKWGIALMSSSVTYFFGGWSGVLGVLLVFVILDYLTGIAAAGMSGKLESNVGMFGIARKVFIFAMVSVAHLVDGVLGDGHLFRDAVAFFISQMSCCPSSKTGESWAHLFRQ